MKKALLIAIGFLFVFGVNAQKRIATPLPAKKFSGFSFTGKPTAAACDTLKYDSSLIYWSGFLYVPTKDTTVITQGFTFGVSQDTLSTSIKEDANYYDVSGSDYSYITGGLVDFDHANSNKPADLNKNLIFKVYDDDGTGKPGNLLGSSIVKLSKVKNDVNNNLLTQFVFATPIAIPENKIFYVSIDHSDFKWDNTTKDSIAILANGDKEAQASAYQYIYFSDAGQFFWLPVNQLYPTDNTGDNYLNVDLFIFPFVTNTLGSCSVLPVSILNFKGSINDNKAMLAWRTATEFNNKGFAVERSKDGKVFTQIGFVNGAGTTTQRKDYTFIDATLSDIGVATMYYRLKQIDKDGKTSYSKVIPLSLRNIVDWEIYPNPVKDKLTVELNLTADTKVNVQIISKDGRLLLNADKGILPQGLQQLNFNVQNIASGSYFIRVKAGEKYYTQTIVKQ